MSQWVNGVKLPELHPTRYCEVGKFYLCQTEFGQSIVVHPDTLAETARLMGEDMVSVMSVARVTMTLWAAAVREEATGAASDGSPR